MNRTRIQSIGLAALLALLAGCSTDKEAEKKRLVENGNKYFNSGKYKEASLIYQTVIQKDALYGEAYYRLGLSELKAGRPLQAVRALRRASELQPNNNDAHSKLADIYMTAYLADRQKNKPLLVDLKDLRDRLLKLNPKSFEGLRISGYLELAENNTKAALDHFNAAEAINPGNPQIALIVAEILFVEKRNDEAEARLVAAIEKHKDFYVLHDRLYVYKMGQGKVDKAEAILRRKVAASPKDAIPVLELAGHFFGAKKPDEMKKALETLTAKTNEFPDSYVQVGDFYFRIGNFAEAQTAYEAGIKATPKEARKLRKKLVELAAVQGKFEDAIARADALVDEDKDDPESRALRAALRLRSGKKEEVALSVKEFEGVLSKMPDNPVVRYNLGEAYAAQGQPDKAQAQFLEAVKLRPAYGPPKIGLARLHLGKAEFAKAQQYADDVIKVQPTLVAPYLLRAATLMGMNDFKGARNLLEDVLRRKPELRDAQYMLSQTNMLDRRLDTAEEGFRSMVQGGDTRGVFGLVDVYLVSKREDRAAEMLKKELEKPETASKPAYVKALRTALAMVATATKRYDEAIGYYQALLQADPKALDVMMRLGDTYMRAGKWSEAYSTFEAAKNGAPNEAAPLLQMALALESQNKRAEARPLYEQILRVAPDNVIALNNYAYWLVETNGDLDVALKHAQRAKQLAPGDLNIADTLGWVYLKKNLSDDAVRIFTDLVKQRPKHVTWRYHLALSLAQKGDKLQAKRELQEAMRNSPNGDEDRKIQELMRRIG